jgi:hypothetical protein
MRRPGRDTRTFLPPRTFYAEKELAARALRATPSPYEENERSETFGVPSWQRSSVTARIAS